MATTIHGTLTADEITSVSVEWGYSGIVVVNRSMEGVIWVRLDGENPVPEGPGTYSVYGARDFPLRRRESAIAAALSVVTVKLLTDADRDFSVEAIG